MNILPKKRWHVRTKDNIARVRRDEANAKAEEEERQRKIQLANQEARTDFLRKRARGNNSTSDHTESTFTEHVNFFDGLEDGKNVPRKNEENEAEKKAEQEKYEKNIGLLTYLGQNSSELLDKKPWWQEKPGLSNEEELEKNKQRREKQQKFLDPMHSVSRHLKYFEKHKKEKKEEKLYRVKKKSRDHKKSSSKTIEELRAERLSREKREKERTANLLAKHRGEQPKEKTQEFDDRSRKYNSQFNPHLSKF